MLSQFPFDATIAKITWVKHFNFKRKDHWRRNDCWYTEQNSVHFDATIDGHKFVRSLQSYGTKPALQDVVT